MGHARVGPLTRERRRELTRTALIEAAADLFARKGFNGTSLEEIAQTAGFTRGAIYKNFRSKEEIILAVVEWHVEIQLAAYADLLEGMSTPAFERATAAADVWARFFRRDPSLTLLELELRLHALRNPEFRPRLVEWELRWRNRIARFIEQQTRAAGLTLGISAADLSAFTLAGVEGLSQAASVHPEERERYDRLVALLFQLVSSLLTPAAPTEQPQARRARSKAKRTK
jgi:AcrR family transcriptional regulator